MNTIARKWLHTVGTGAILCALAASCAGVAVAGDHGPPQVTVKFSDLDLATSPGAAALYGRIERAAREVCERLYGSTAAYRFHAQSCLRRIIGDAVTKVDRPSLTAVFAARHGGQPKALVLAETGAR